MDPKTKRRTAADSALDPVLVPVHDAARLLNTSESTVWKLAREGVIDRVRLGTRTTRFKAEQIRQLAGINS
jgi:excisionase family DNA binding protein